MSVPASHSQALPTLATQPLPRRVRELLATTLKIAALDLERTVSAAINDFEQQAGRQSDGSSFVAGLDRWQNVMSIMQRSRFDVVVNFMRYVEAEMASLQQPQIMRGHLQTRYRAGDALALVNDQEIEETSALTEAATRAELQNSLPLFLLGQRFGVLAGRPAFDAETLPIGPQGLCRSMRHAVEALGLEVDARLLFYRAFERQVMPGFGSMVDVINAELASNGVLPNLQYVPVRARRVEQKPAADGDPPTRNANPSPRGAQGDGETTRTSGAASPGASRGGMDAPDDGLVQLRELLSNRRQLLGKLDRTREGARDAPRLVTPDDLQEVLRGMQSSMIEPTLSHGRRTTRSIGHVKQDMLAMLRRTSADQEPPMLSDEHSDAIDLIGMLYDNLMKDVKPGGSASDLLSKLQVPLIRVAVQDPGFLARADHPARQLLSTIAETGIHWLGDGDNDPALVNQLHSIVDRAVHDFQDDPSAFRTVDQELQSHLQTLSRKSEAAERRHVEAARGKEKLNIAREHASECIEALVAEQTLPRFTRTMLCQAWTDVMALTALRQGAESAEWQRQLDVAERLVDLAQRPAGHPTESAEADIDLQREIEEGLSKVGYQGDDVTAIAGQLVHPNVASLDENSSRTELTMRLKARARLGEDLSARKSKRIPLTSAEQAQMQYVKEAPIGSWFEFSDGPGSDKSRRRLSWLSTATGDALFVNQRGQKNSDYTLESLARLMARGQVRMLEEEKGTLVDRSWEGVMTALRSFALPTAEGDSAR